MLARINKHIPKASELQMVTLTLFLIANTISCPAWDSMQITGEELLEMNLSAIGTPSKSVQFLNRNRSLLDAFFCSADLRQMHIAPSPSPPPSRHWISEYFNPIYQTGEPLSGVMSSI